MLTVRKFAPTGESASAARRFVAEALADLDFDLQFAADLLTGELVANALLHAGTDISVEVDTAGDGARIAVTDEAPDRPLLPRTQDTEATTGRGLQLIEAMAFRYGVSATGSTKTVWFELKSGDPARPLSTWEAPERRPAPHVTVRLVDAPIGLSRAAQRHRRSLIREAQLALPAGEHDLGVSQRDLLTTAGLNDLLDAALNASHEAQPAESATMECALEIPPDSGPAAATLAWVLDALNEAATRGVFLTRPALPEVRRFRLWLIGEILRQLEGDPPTPWSLEPPGDDPVKGQPVRWDSARIHESTVATVAADDDNRFIAINEAAGELLGWSPPDLVGQRLTVIIPPSHRERHVAGFTTFLLTGETRLMGLPFIVPALRSDGTTVLVTLTLRVEHSNLGRVVFVGELRPAR